MFLFSGSLLAQSDLEEKTYLSVKNGFSNKYQETMQAHKAFWVAEKKVQEQDIAILQREKKILTSKVDLENIKRGLDSEKGLKKILADKSKATKDTVFVKSGDKFRFIDVNDSKLFNEPKSDSEICLKDNTRCFPFTKDEDGKRVFNLSKKEVNTESLELREAQKALLKEMKEEEKKKEILLVDRNKVKNDSEAAEKVLQSKKAALVQYVADPKSKVDEKFIDKLLEDPKKKETLFGTFELIPEDSDTKEKMMTALDQKVFNKGTYGLLKDAVRYEDGDKAYNELLSDVTKLNKDFNQSSSTVASAKGPASVTAAETEVAKRSKGEKPVAASDEAGPSMTASDAVSAPAAEKNELSWVNAVAAEEDKNKAAVEPKEDEAKKEASSCVKDVDDDEQVYLDCLEKSLKKAVAAGDAAPCVKDADDDEEAYLECLEKSVAKVDGKKEDAEAAADEKKEPQTKEALCKQKAVAELLELFKDEKLDILGQQFNLTAMKTALYLKDKVAKGSVSKSLEDVVNKQQSELGKDSKIKSLKDLYTKHGLEKAGPGLDSLTEKLQDPKHKFNYFGSNSRMTNEEASNLYLLLDKSDTDIKFGMEDAAIAWAFGKVNKAKKGSIEYNKLSISTQVNKLMDSSVAGGINMSAEKLKENIKKSDEGLNSAMTGAFLKLSEECRNIIGQAEGCVLYSDIKIDAFAAMMKDIAEKTEPATDDKKIAIYSLQFDKFIGSPGDDDYKTIGKGNLGSKSIKIGNLKQEIQDKLHLAAGMAYLSQKDGDNVTIDKKCYSFKYEKSHVNLGVCSKSKVK